MPLDLRHDHLAIVREILRQHVPDREVWAFGSRVRGTARAASDLDLCIRGDEPLGFERLGRLKDAFSTSALPFRVDVVEWASTAASFRKVIEGERVAINSQPTDRDAWPVVPVVDVCSLVVDCVNKTAPRVEYPTPFKMIRTPNVKGGRVDLSDCKYVTEEVYERWTRRAKVIEGDVLLTREAPVGEVGLVRKTDTVFLGQRLMQYRANPELLDNLFLLYAFLSPPLQNQFHAHGGPGSTVDHIRVPDCSKFEIPLPRIEEQQAIAAVLGALDDRIELNRRMNETLEAMARALFKDWFVDFGPVRAKAEGRPAYLAPEIWDLFPAAMDDDDKPVGWRFGALMEVAESPRRGVQPAEVSEDTPYIGLEHMPRRSIALADWAHAGKVTSNKSVFNKGEFLFGKLRPYFHKVGITAISGICSTDIVVVRPKAKEWGAYVLSCISSDPFVNYTDQLSNGAKMPRISWNDMGAYGVCLPGKPLAQAFENTVAPMLGQIIHNIHASRTLAQLRDLLLPKLMTGALRVRDAEKAVENAL